ncbi:MAG: hypothetical protein ACLRMZ_25990 [Blautia marasmi]
MEFIIRKAGYEDIPGIMAVMKDAQKAMEHPEWFCSDREEYMKKHIETYGLPLWQSPFQVVLLQVILLQVVLLQVVLLRFFFL